MVFENQFCIPVPRLKVLRGLIMDFVLCVLHYLLQISYIMMDHTVSLLCFVALSFICRTIIQRPVK